jgi:PhzF family phenazine biosynthesis protein
MPQTIYQVDAFAERPFSGNPAAVCVLPEARDATWMQNVAREMNLSETAFLVRRADGSYDLRWFTPGVEVDLCGHATLASAHLLWEIEAIAPAQEAVFHTKSGRLSARQQEGRIVMNFPAEPPSETEAPAGLIEAIGAAPVFVSRNRMDYLLLFESEATVRALKPDMSQLAHIDVRGVIATAQADGGDYDFVSRFFAPAAGVPEDPVTGSAHCCLGPFWQQRLGKDHLVGYQASDRGGTVYVHPDGDRVHLGGYAVTVMQGNLLDV